MKSLERRHKNVAVKNPNLSSLVCFYHAVHGGNFSPQTVSRYFHFLVDKGDYQRSDTKAILRELYSISKPAEDDKK